MVAASKAGAIKVLVKTGAGQEALHKYRHKWQDMNADYIARDLEDAISWLLRMR